MIVGILIVCSLALVGCQETHPTHHPHPTHPTHGPAIDHTFSATNAVFLQDLEHKVIILKTDSGCYVTHLNDEEIKHLEDVEKLLHLEAMIVHQVRGSHHFAEALHSNVFNAAIQKACPKIYAYHKEHE